MRLHATRRAAIAQGRGLGNPLWDLAGVPASLDLRFAESKSLVDAVSGQQLITFTRASDGAVVNSAGQIEIVAANVPRFDHNPVTGESLGLLVEEQRTNLLLRSEEFDDATWFKANLSATGNVATAPDGNVTADKLVEDTASSTHVALQSFNITSGTTYTLSCYAKAAGRNFAQLLFVGGFASNVTAIFDLTNGSIGATGGSPVTTSTSMGNGWYRLSITATATTTTSTSIQIRPAIASNAANYQGDGTSGIFAWGAQLETGAFPTSYIPTTATAVTRSADVVSISGSNFSAWFNGLQGTMFASGFVEGRGAGSFSRLFAFVGANAGTDEISMYTRVNIDPNTNGKVFGVATVSSVVTGDVTTPTGASAGNYVSAFAYRENDFALASNGFGPTTDTSGSLPTCERLLIYGQARFQNMPHGTIKRFCFWPTRLSNSTLQAVTQ
jgi:hypothetical protein